MCSCSETPTPDHPQVDGPLPTSQTMGQWAPMRDPKPHTAPRNCECGCNTYSPLSTLPGIPSTHSAAFRDIPALPLDVTYEDDDVSDEHEYVSIHVAELSNLLHLVRSCECGQSST